MQYKSVKGISGWGQFGLLLAFTALGILLTTVVQFVITLPLLPSGSFKDLTSDQIMSILMKPENVNSARLLQVLGTFCMLFVPSCLFALVVSGKNPFWLGFSKHFNFVQIIIAVVVMFLATMMAGPLSDLSRKLLSQMPSLNEMANKLESTYNDQVTAISNLKSWPEFLIALVIMAFLPAMFEEIYFRGVIQNLFVRWWKLPVMAIIASSLIFSLVHMSVYLFLSRMVLGFVLGWMYYRSKNIWVNIFAHFINNAMALTALFWYNLNKKPVTPDKIDPRFTVWTGLIALFFTCFLFYAFEAVSKKKRALVTARELELESESPYNTFAESNT